MMSSTEANPVDWWLRYQVIAPSGMPTTMNKAISVRTGFMMVRYYHASRMHLALGKDSPDLRSPAQMPWWATVIVKTRPMPSP